MGFGSILCHLRAKQWIKDIIKCCHWARTTNIGLLYPSVRNNIGGIFPLTSPNQNIGGDVSPAGWRQWLMIIMAAFKIKNPINPICLNSFIICSDTSEKNLTSRTNYFYSPHPWGIWHKHTNSQFQSKWPIIGTDWGIMGYNDVIVCVTLW